jgi:DNA-binding response OmpR family regulator
MRKNYMIIWVLATYLDQNVKRVIITEYLNNASHDYASSNGIAVMINNLKNDTLPYWAEITNKRSVGYKLELHEDKTLLDLERYIYDTKKDFIPLSLIK